VGIPAIPFTASGGQLQLSDITSITVDSKYAERTDEKGETLIPPTLNEFAQTFASDLKELGIGALNSEAGNTTAHSIFLTLGNPSDYLDIAGRESSEGYTLTVSASGIHITGASPLGVWWGTRTLLQQAATNNGSIPFGSVTDTPGWSTRGMMLDVGRKYYPPEFLVDMCAYMSFFKQNTFHIHLSDNLYNNVELYDREASLNLYARFRLYSEAEELAGLNTHLNESYTREQFEHVQSACASRGVTVLPEIEAPGHALAIVQWKPELGIPEKLTLLNISHPDTIPTMKTIWNTFLPWFQSKTVHIGADEYTAGRNDYNLFVNIMADHIYTVSNKSTRIWGTFPPVYNESDYINIYKNVTVQHWAFFEDNPLYDYVENNYTVLNSDDTYYVVAKWSGSYPQVFPTEKTFTGDPSTKSSWYPNVFDAKNSSNNPPRNEPLILGEVAPLWNDYGPNASVVSEAYYAWREGIPAIADKQWGGDLRSAELLPTLETLHHFIPGQNLERDIPSRTSTIVEYNFDSSNCTGSSPDVRDRSENGYDGSTDCVATADGALRIDSCSLKTPLVSKGRDYTLTLTLLILSLDNTDAILVSGSDSTLMLTPNITFFADGNYFRLNSTLPLNQEVELSIIARGNQTFSKVNNGIEEEFLARLGVNGERFEWGPMAFEAPLQEVGGPNGGWTGELRSFRLSSVA
jgi:hexosaminidase